MKLAMALVALALTTALAACGGSAATRTPSLAQVPLVPGSRITAQARRCDKGSAAFCAVQLVVVNRAFNSEEDFMKAERELLKAHGWTSASGDTGDEKSADSPGHKLHLTYGTATGDLEGWAFNWIKRQPAIIYALSNSVFDDTAALSLLLEVGSGAT